MPVSSKIVLFIFLRLEEESDEIGDAGCTVELLGHAYKVFVEMPLLVCGGGPKRSPLRGIGSGLWMEAAEKGSGLWRSWLQFERKHNRFKLEVGGELGSWIGGTSREGSARSIGSAKRERRGNIKEGDGLIHGDVMHW